MSVNEKKRVWVYDLEQFQNLHTGTFINRDDPENIGRFVIYEGQNDIHEYIEFLKNEVGGLIGFNNLKYDYPLLHFLMMLYRSGVTNAEDLNALLYDESNKLINSEYTDIPERQVLIPQLDLSRIHHFDNKAKMTSLKALEIAIQFDDVQDLPYDENHYILPDEVDEVLSYNLNDVQATHKFYELSIPMVNLRKELTKTYKINLRNANDPKIGQEIFGRELARLKRIRYEYLRDARTYRHFINLGDCLLPYISFKTKEFKQIHEFFKNETITTTYKAFEESVIYKGLKYDYGTGGLHACTQSGVYESDDLHMILDIDVASYYPSLAIVNGFYPQHLGKDFVTIYKRLFDRRMEAKRNGEQAVNSGLKLALNGVYGKSNDQYSLFYDPMYTMKVTVNGQLLLSMLAENLAHTIGDLKVLQANTDGITIHIPRNCEGVVKTICEDWEELTGMTLEYAEYNKMIIRDVNNYLAIDTNNKAKPKGCFEIIPMQNGAVAFNKNWSMRVVPKALHAYYIHGMKPEDYIRNHEDIYDFAKGFRSRGDWDVWAGFIESNRKVEVKQQKTIRYFMSNNGVILTKINRIDGRRISLESGKTSTMFNKYQKLEPFEKYNINYNYYISETYKIINAVDDGQLKLF